MTVEIFLGIFIGAVTFTGSVVAFGKLSGKIDGKVYKLPGGHGLNLVALICAVLLGILYFYNPSIWTLLLVSILAGFIGWHLR